VIAGNQYGRAWFGDRSGDLIYHPADGYFELSRVRNWGSVVSDFIYFVEGFAHCLSRS